MKTKKPKAETIYRCPFCSKMPKIEFNNNIVGVNNGNVVLEKEWVAWHSTTTHRVECFAPTRSAVIKRWNKGR